jgi:hypothetical protein
MTAARPDTRARARRGVDEIYAELGYLRERGELPPGIAAAAWRIYAGAAARLEHLLDAAYDRTTRRGCGSAR